ncbi:Crp/Fnr family transcriptional regulator [Streptomyces marincola]|nr:Crp/Fnr family transcriptional regulator [Streptomyces marincola]
MADVTSLSVLDTLDDAQLEALEALGGPVRFPAGHTIFWEGQPSRDALILRKGLVKVVQASQWGTVSLLAVRGSGEVLGDEGVLSGEPRSASVTTITPVEGLSIKGEDLLFFVEGHRLWPVMYRAAVRRRRQSDAAHLAYLALPVSARLARLLIGFADAMTREGGGKRGISVPLSQNDLASAAGASREAVVRSLRLLRDRGLVATGRGAMVVEDVEALRRFVDSR